MQEDISTESKNSDTNQRVKKDEKTGFLVLSGKPFQIEDVQRDFGNQNDRDAHILVTSVR